MSHTNGGQSQGAGRELLEAARGSSVAARGVCRHPCERLTSAFPPPEETIRPLARRGHQGLAESFLISCFHVLGHRAQRLVGCFYGGWMVGPLRQVRSDC